MIVAIYVLETIKRDVRINLGRRDIGMAKNCLDRPQVSAIFHHVGCTAMAKSMWAGMGDACGCGIYHLPSPLAAQAAGMQQDFSWDRSAAEYVKIYDRVRAVTR